MAQYSVGRSSYGDLNGVTQYVNSQRIAQQFLSMARDYRDKFGASGNRLTVNEGMRSRPRQDQLYRKFLAVGYPVAATPYTSRHDAVLRGNAIDVGVTERDGTNRALTPTEFAWMHEQAERRGFTWTGRYFDEPWHIEGATRAEVVAPYPGVTPENVYDAPKPDPVEAIKDIVGDEEMNIIWSDKHKYALGIIGSKIYKFREKDAAPITAQKLNWFAQAKLFTKATRVNPNDDWSGDKNFNETELDQLAAIIGRFK